MNKDMSNQDLSVNIGTLYSGINTYESVPVKNWYLLTFGKIPNFFSIGGRVYSEEFLKKNKKNIIQSEMYAHHDNNREYIYSCVFQMDNDGVVVVMNDNRLDKKEGKYKASMYVLYREETAK